jgi:hypothetical protein
MKKRRTLLTILVLAAFVTGIGLLYRYAHACHNVACAKLHDEWFQAHFDPAVTIYLMPQNAEPILARIENEQIRENARRIITRLSAPAAPTPAANGASTPVTCAVVGNSGNLLGSGYGPRIDGHQYVLRMNNAPLTGYENDIGTRTTHHILHTRQDHIDLYDHQTLTLFAYDAWGFDYKHAGPQKADDYTLAREAQWLGNQVGGGRFPPPFHSGVNTSSSPGAVYLFHPDFLSYIDKVWFQPKHYQSGDYPSVGFKTLIYAFHLCDQIDLYGFGANKRTNRWDHYFDRGNQLSEWPALHRADYQEEFLKKLQEHGIITIYPGNDIGRESVRQ